ncbi:RagB/SusD family nutrient uptake outer membrane protein [Polaribacter batillariae]|uniref:RagB/SusD family nutrient uptake outer membrane protein n=1 Tax=Polaribacter batillariae TaxID=2808900 RepID=A0ABX7ST68_9FLAO|nr:RagB/SusD family nutrient uptake outer membrane protein [Polaribacter batillariae]QTD37346.1 RagB/SusD family nutrient uptake outer membrane protein [Polaribacter batillariae]
MKNIKKYTTLTMIVCLFASFSCTSILDQEPVNITHPDVFWSNQSNAEQALAGAYATFKEAITKQANFIYWGDIPAMTFMRSRDWISGYIQNGGDYVLPYRGFSRDWKDLYRAANWALTIEKHVSEMPDNLFASKKEKDRIIGEAAFVRGLSYFWIARIWGDAPIVNEAIESSTQLINSDGFVVRIPRSNELEVLDFALEATNKAIDLLNYQSPGATNWAIIANKASAEALKADLTLWYAARDNNNPDMLKASIEAATNVINNSGAELIDYVAEGKDGFDNMCTGGSKTGLFEINMNAGMNESFRISSSGAHYTGLTLNFPIWKNKNTNVSPVIDPDYYGKKMMRNDPDRANDVRKDIFFYDYDSDENSFPLKYSHTSKDPSTEDAYALFSESNILIYRMADMYLLRAEAYAKSNQAGNAVADLNLTRSKANVPNYTGAMDKESLIEAIFEERSIEFVAEGKSAFDRIRMDFYEDVPWMNQSRIAKKGYFWPIDPTIISNNPSIVQTEYWRGAL